MGEEIKITLDEESGEIEIVIDCPEDENASISAFGAFGRSPEDIFKELENNLKEEGIELEVISTKSFVNKKVQKERNKLLKIISKK